jgi:hypothetical protein
MEQLEQSQSPQAQSSRTVMSPSQRREYWQDIFARQATSGLSIKVFCEQEKVSYQGFFDYKRRLREEPIRTQEKITFAPVTVVPHSSATHESAVSGSIEIMLSDRKTHV